MKKPKSPRRVRTEDPRVKKGDSVEVLAEDGYEFLPALSSVKESKTDWLRVKTSKGWAIFIEGQEKGEVSHWYLEDPPGPSLYLKKRKPKLRVYRKLPPGFASDYIARLRLLSRKHKTDDAKEVKSILRLLKSMSSELFYAGRGEVWIPKPSPRTGYYPIIEKVPYSMVRRAIRSNTSGAERARAWGAVSSSVEPFVPLFARRPGSLTEAQRRSLLAHALVALPLVKGRHPSLLGRRVPGELGVSDIGTRSVIPVKRMAPEDWEKGFTMRKFSLSEDLTKSIKRRLVQEPRVPNPKLQAPKVDLKDVLKRATDTGVKLEPERRDYAKHKKSRLKKVLTDPFVVGAGIHSATTLLILRKMMQVIKEQRAAEMRKRRPMRMIPHMTKLVKSRVYTLSDIDRMCYEDGFREWLERAKRKTGRALKKVTRWVKGTVLPTVARDVTLGVTGLAHTELGIPPTTVDLLPVQRIGLKRDLQPYPSMQLRKVVESLQTRLVSEVDPVLRKGLEKGISEIATELMVRKSMPGFV